jgi:hypothetical protein
MLPGDIVENTKAETRETAATAHKSLRGVATGAGVCVFVLWLAAWGLIRLWYGAPSGPGVFGDQFGALNALFSGLAFAGVIFAILLQRQELELQRRELELTRQELQGQKKQLEAQNETMRRQSFESTFFGLLRLHNEIVDSLAFKPPGHPSAVEGRRCFSPLWDWFGFLHQNTRGSREEVYAAFWDELGARLDHYYRNIASVLDFILTAPQNASRYARIFRSQLSEDELLLLFYHCLNPGASITLLTGIQNLPILVDVPRERLLWKHDANLLEEGPPLNPEP